MLSLCRHCLEFTPGFPHLLLGKDVKKNGIAFSSEALGEKPTVFDNSEIQIKGKFLLEKKNNPL